ncbi:NUDIX hydrolase [Nocardioides insulae]|uniref:NUDIX hydrolase n=1 Tax=Nocardioides insulae TaxID=394734 RepID=UPI000686B572|nr:NUDIX domain-containing protein [Nocardioides insulae]
MSSGPSRRRPRHHKLPKVQRVAAYAVILRPDAKTGELMILLSRLSDALVRRPTWTLPGGGLDHGEDPRQAVVREVYEETGLPVEIGETAWVFSAHRANTWRRGRRVDSHALRIVYDGWVPLDAPPPQTTEVGGSTEEAAWLRLDDVLAGKVGTLELVREALAVHRPTRLQRVAAYALITRPEQVLLTRISERGFHSGAWTLPGGGIDFGESPREALVREVREECGLKARIGEVLEVDDVSVTGTAPSGRHEDFHGVHLVFAATVRPGAEPRVVEQDGTTDEVAWISRAAIDAGEIEVLDVVRSALTAASRRGPGDDLGS